MRLKGRIPEQMSEATKRRWEQHRLRRRRQYIAAIPMGWISPTFRHPPYVTKVALAVWFQVKRSRPGGAPISAQLLEQFGVSRKTAYLALCKLEIEGLITVDRQRGRAPLVTIIQESEQ